MAKAKAKEVKKPAKSIILDNPVQLQGALVQTELVNNNDGTFNVVQTYVVPEQDVKNKLLALKNQLSTIDTNKDKMQSIVDGLSDVVDIE